MRWTQVVIELLLLVRDRVVKYYEESDRRVTIVDRNNQFLVDQSYAAHLSNTGLIAPHPTNNLQASNAAMGELAARDHRRVGARSMARLRHRPTAIAGNQANGESEDLPESPAVCLR